MGLPKILIVDDEADNLAALKRLLRKDFEVIACESGEEALKVVEEKPFTFEAIISDQRMPGLTGSEFFEKVQKIDNRATRVLLTGFADLDAIIDAVNRGHIWRYVSKPWEPEDLKITIKQACERTLMQKSIDESRSELSRLLIELKAKDWARERLLKILMHEFRTAPQIIEAIKSLEPPGDEHSEERKRFLSRLSERLQILENDISDLLSDEKTIAQESKARFSLRQKIIDFCEKTHLVEPEFEGFNHDPQVFLPESLVEKSFQVIVDLLKQNSQQAPVHMSAQLLLSPSSETEAANIFLSFKVAGNSNTPLIPTGLSKTNLDPPLAWRTILEPFVGIDDFERHSAGLRIEVARTLRQILAMGIRYDVQVSKNMDQVEFILDFKIPR